MDAQHQPWLLEYPAPTPPWSTNQERTKHWGWVKRRVEAWRDAAFYHAKATPGMRELPPSVVKMTLWFPTNRRRDPHNYTGTVVKATIDGFVHARVWPDDTPQWVSVGDPIIEIAPKQRHMVSIRVLPV